MEKGEKIKFEVKRDNTIRKEVSNRVFIPVIHIINEKGLKFKDYLEGIPYDELHFFNKRERVEWWVYRQFVINTRRDLSYMDYEKIGAEFIQGGTYIEGLLGFFLLTSPKTFKLLADKILQRITANFLCLKMQIEYVDSNWIRFILELPDGYEHFPEFAYGNKGIIRELGNRIGLKECRVGLRFIPNGAVYEMKWSKKDILFKIRKGFRWLFNINKAFRELTDSHEELLREYEKLEDYKNNLELKVDERTAELKKAHDKLSETIKLLKEAQQAQNRFFTNISHEFRTPLTLIIGPAKQLIESTDDEKTIGELKLIHKNAKRVLTLINQLLDLSKIESGEMKLLASPQNIIPLLKAFLQSFSSYAETKRITLKFDSFNEEVIVFIDKDKIEKIITNLLSNAIKFTPEGGQVELTVAGDNKYITIQIRDTGIGIPEEEIPKIFDRFYQVDGTHTREQQGTGIGLALTKELIDLHKAQINVESIVRKGTTIRVILPLGKEYLDPDQICQQTENESGISIPIENFQPEVSLTNPVHDPLFFNSQLFSVLPDENLNRPVLLIIEDNVDVRNYVKNILGHNYRILEAADGVEGWTKSSECLPDLIISDIMMPKMDGFSLCSRLKNDERTSHVPVILLTAKAGIQDKIEGLETGADDYIMKPFEAEELKVRIKNLIEQRKRIHEHFRKHGLFEIETNNITPVDQIFLQRTAAIINENIADPSFGVETLANKMAVSRSLLLKKLESLVGESPNDLIKRTRLNKAAKLIENKFGNILEIALEVGYNNPSYFAECFKKQFGISPSQYH